MFARRILAIHAIALVVAALAGAAYVTINHQDVSQSMMLAGIGIVLFVALAGYFLRSAAQASGRTAFPAGPWSRRTLRHVDL